MLTIFLSTAYLSSHQSVDECLYGTGLVVMQTDRLLLGFEIVALFWLLLGFEVVDSS